jgi:hypothetical protein
MDEIKIIYEVFDAIAFSAAGCNCTVIFAGTKSEAESLIVVIQPPPR